jgi:TRAP-type C4-dicarboxylate transport system permease small subunit
VADDLPPRDADTPRMRPGTVLFRVATEGVSAVVLFLLMAMTCVDVFGREVLAAPLDGATELTRLMLGVIVFGVLPAVSRREDHVTVDLLDPVFPPRAGQIREAVLNLVCAVALAAVCWRVWFVGADQLEYGDATEFLRIPLGPVSWFISVLSGIAAAAMIWNAAEHLLGRDRTVARDSAIT